MQSAFSILKGTPSLQRCARSFTTSRAVRADKLLFTPGPLLTSPSVKAAMQRDLGSRDIAFLNVIKEVRSGTLKLANLNEKEYTMVPVQGSGTFGVEATLSTAVPQKNGGLLVVANGAYGQRMEKISKAQGIHHHTLLYGDDTPPSLQDITKMLEKNPEITHVATVHSETTSGIINDIVAIGQLVKKYNKTFIVDAMSSFGAIPIDFEKAKIDYLVTSANKCIQGVPGFAVVIARRSELDKSKGNARTLSLDVWDQNRGLDSDGQFRFTPPTHALLAYRQALKELEEEGGVAGRFKRYSTNHKIVDTGMTEMGFKSYLKPELRGPIISTYKYPNDPNWSFSRFYEELNKLDMVIYPGKVTNADSFRIGHIGHLFPKDCEKLLKDVTSVCKIMKVDPTK